MKSDINKFRSIINEHYSLNESMDFSPVKKANHPDHGEYWSWALPKEWTDEYLSADYSRDEFPSNPNYRPDLALNMSNRNARIVMDALGVPGDGEGYHMEINQFINLCVSWLRQHLNKPSKGFDTIFQQRTTNTSIVNFDFLARQKENSLRKDASFIERMTDVYNRFSNGHPNIVSPEGKARVGAGFVKKYPTFNDFLDVRIKNAVDDFINQKKYEVEQTQRTGPKMIEGGLDDGYINKQVKRMLDISREGIKHGATHISVI